MSPGDKGWERRRINLIKYLYKDRLNRSQNLENVQITCSNLKFEYLNIRYSGPYSELYWVSLRNYLIHGDNAFKTKYKNEIQKRNEPI